MGDDFENWLSERKKEAPVDNGELSIGTIVGDYRIVALLGRGGFAEVYRAVSSNNEHVAIKILHRQDAQSRLRFEREAKILSQIHHANTPRLITFGILGSRPYLVMELLRADELPHTGRAVGRLIRKVCAAVTALHKMGYVHRDIKPANILWRGNEPVLIDYGLACPFSDGIVPPSTLSIVDGHRIVVGTAGYAAPEQFAGGKIDASTDIHAIGMLANSCFEGRPPWRWRKIIDRATNSRSNARYKTAKKLARAVSRRYIPILGWSVVGIALLCLLLLLCGAAAYAFFAINFMAGFSWIDLSESRESERIKRKALYLPEQISMTDIDMLTSYDCCEVLQRHPELIDKIGVERLCHTFSDRGREFGRLIKGNPGLEKQIDLSRLPFNAYEFVRFLLECPHLVDRVDKKLLSQNWDWLLPVHPEWRDKCDFSKLNSYEWGVLLAKTDCFDNECDFAKLNGSAWAEILQHTDRLDSKCDFTKLKVDDWVKVLEKTRRFDGRLDASGFKGKDWVKVLETRPDLISVCSNVFTGADVAIVLKEFPWMTNKCDLSSLTPRDWGEVLKDNPQFLPLWNRQGYKSSDWHSFAKGYFEFDDDAELTLYKVKALWLNEEDQKSIDKYIIYFDEQEINDIRFQQAMKRAKKGDCDAINLIGVWFQGFGDDAPVERNDKLAVMWYMKGVSANNPESMALLGDCYRNGIGLETNLVRAVELYKMSAERNCALGTFLLGECYLLGVGTSANASEAVRLFRAAKETVEWNDYKLQKKIYYRLGGCYEDGIGVPVDLCQAREWYSEAARKGCEQSRVKVESMDSKLNASSGVKR